jgi:hypothetical protein
MDLGDWKALTRILAGMLDYCASSFRIVGVDASFLSVAAGPVQRTTTTAILAKSLPHARIRLSGSPASEVVHRKLPIVFGGRYDWVRPRCSPKP